MKNISRTVIVLAILLAAAVALAEQGGKLLIIAADQFVNAVQPLAAWKTQKGLLAKVVPVSQAGQEPRDIRNFIRTAHDSWVIKPEFVLLVGSPDFIPSHDNNDDCYYGDLGDGFEMELSVGRLFATTIQECSTMVAKILAYEKPDAQSDTAWYRKGTTVVCEDNPPDEYYQIDSRMARERWLADGYVVAESLMNLWGDTSADVTAAANDGRTFITYRGQGVSTWWYPFHLIDPFSWTNGYRLPVVIAGSCATVTLAPGETMYGDKFVRAGTTAGSGGAVAYFGTTRIGSEISKYRSACYRGFFHALFDHGVYLLGPVTLNARRQILDSVSRHAELRYTEWNLLGDPTMPVWVGGVPKPATVQYAFEPPLTPTVLKVWVRLGDRKVRGARVCAWKQGDGGFYVTDTTDAQGFTELPLPPHTEGSVLLTVSEGHAVGEAPHTPILPHEETIWTPGSA